MKAEGQGIFNESNKAEIERRRKWKEDSGKRPQKYFAVAVRISPLQMYSKDPLRTILSITQKHDLAKAI